MSINLNSTITGGSVTVEDGLKAKEEFAPARKVAVTLNFSTPEGTDGVALLEHVSGLANSQQARLMYTKASSVELAGRAPAAAATPAATPAKAETKAQKTAREKREADALAASQPQKTKADLAREAGLPTEDTTHTTEADELDDEPEAPAATATDKDELADLLGETAPVPVTDAELGKAAQEKNGDMKGKPGWAPEKIRELVAKFVLVDGKPKPGAKLQDIPAAQRHDFLEQLKALK